MNIDIDTRKMDFKKDDLLIYDGKQFKKISKKELLKPLNDEIENIKKEKDIYENILEQRFIEFADRTIKGLISR